MSVSVELSKAAIRDQAVSERLEAAARLNARFYAELERHISALDRAEQERDAWAAHARDLAQKLIHAQKHISRLEGALASATGVPVAPAPADPSADNADEDARQLAELLALEVPEPGAGSAPAAASGPGQARAQAGALYPASALSATEETRTAMAAAAAAAPGGAGVTAPPGDWEGEGAAAPIPVNPTPNQQRVLEALVRRGRTNGWLVQHSEVTLGPVLGEGEFGVTYRGTWRHAAVAAKVVRLRHAAELTAFLREVESMSYVRHPHVVPFLGAVLSPGAEPDKLILLSEYMTGGTLSEWLHPDGLPAPGTASGGLLAPPPPLLERLRMAHQVALGMCALSCASPPLLHRDIKPANVYIHKGAARLGDFGLARRLLAGCRATLTGETGTYLYMAPEVMRHEVYDTKADVWSWGVLLSECVSCAMPYGHTYMTPIQVAMAVAGEELAPAVPSALHEEVQLVLRLACQFDPEMRPDFPALADMLGGAIQHMEAQQASRPTLLASLQSSLLGGWSSAWGWGHGHGQGQGRQGQRGRPPPPRRPVQLPGQQGQGLVDGQGRGQGQGGAVG